MTQDPITAGPRWSTSSFAMDEQAVSSETSILGEHLALCKRITGRLFALRCGADAIHRFVAPRFVTTLVVCALLIGISLSLG